MKLPGYPDHGIVLALNSEFLKYAGHEGIAIINKKNFVRYYSFSPGKSMLTTKDNIDYLEFSAHSVKEAIETINDHRENQGLNLYEGVVRFDNVSNDNIENMIEFADTIKNEGKMYSLPRYNCVNFVQDTLEAGGISNPSWVWPNAWHTYMMITED